jgi:hypothetical protein
MGTWRARKRKQWPTTYPHPGINSIRGTPTVGGAVDDYDAESGCVHSLRKWRQLQFFGLGFLALLCVVAWYVWPQVSDFWELMGAFAILGKYFVLAAGPFALIGVVVYYYIGVGTEWPLRTAYRLVMIASFLGLFASAILFSVGYVEDRVGDYGTFAWMAVGFGLLAVVGYVKQRD